MINHGLISSLQNMSQAGIEILPLYHKFSTNDLHESGTICCEKAYRNYDMIQLANNTHTNLFL